MGATTSIEWTDASWTPIRARNRATGKLGWHCTHVSEACRNCYAETHNKRLGTGLAFKPGHLKDVEIFLDEAMLLAPLRWRTPRKIFVCSMTDLFADFIPGEMIDKVFAVMALCPQHTFQVLTKRPERMRAYFEGLSDDRQEDAMDSLYLTDSQAHDLVKVCRDLPLPNVWLGTSAEDQPTADVRIPDLLATPAAVRFVSLEPMLGPIDLTWLTWPEDDHLAEDEQRDGVLDTLRGRGWIRGFDGYADHPVMPNWRYRDGSEGPRQYLGDDRHVMPRLDLVILGGESGPRNRPPRLDDMRSIVHQCAGAGVACFVKQLGRSCIMNRSDAVQAVALGAGWRAQEPGGEIGIVRFRDSHGGDPIEWPADMRVREFPDAR